MKLLAIAGAALAMFSGTVFAAGGTAQAALSVYRYELIDLDPTDNITPSVRFEYSDIWAEVSISGKIDIEYIGQGVASASLSVDDASGAASASNDTHNASMLLGSEGEIRAVGKRDSEFNLSAKTKMVIWGRASVELDVGNLAPGQHAKAGAYAYVYSYGSNVADGYSLSLFSPTDGGTASLDQTFSLEMVNEGDFDMYAYLEHGAYTEGHITTPVPEPSTWLMLGAGLAVTGAIARRRRTVMKS